MNESPFQQEQLRQLSGLLAGSRRTLVFTGAGISTKSGIPDYRGPEGVWTTDKPVMYHDFMTSIDSRRRYWDQKARGRRDFGAALPNATHRALVELEAAGKVQAVVTQNIDGLHAMAGTSPELLVELHGTVREVECQTCSARSDPEEHFAAFEVTGEPPVCACSGFLKPATISFGQQLRTDDLLRASSAASAADLVVALGSTLSVTPAAQIPLIALNRGVPYVIVNRGPTDHDGLFGLTLRIDGDVTDIVPAAIAACLA